MDLGVILRPAHPITAATCPNSKSLTLCLPSPSPPTHNLFPKHICIAIPLASCSHRSNTHGQLGGNSNQGREDSLPKLLSPALFPQREDGNEVGVGGGFFAIVKWNTTCRCAVNDTRLVCACVCMCVCAHSILASIDKGMV